MSGNTLTNIRPNGRALVIGSAACRSGSLDVLQRLGFVCAEFEDPYSAMAELCRKPLTVRALALSLASLYREELVLIQAVKRRWPEIDVWLTQTNGRHAALADAMRYGADGLLADDGLHRTAAAPLPTDQPPTPPDAAPADRSDSEQPPPGDSDFALGEPILTAEELRALLSEQPITTPEE